MGALVSHGRLSQLRVAVVPVFRGSIFMSSKMLFLNVYLGNFPGGRGAKTPREPRFDPWSGN